ncbi:hypothetical protein GCM10027614_50020 [Micromonospora vulcania]
MPPERVAFAAPTVGDRSNHGPSAERRGGSGARTIGGLSAPAQRVQSFVVDAEMMGDLVHHGHRHLVDDVLVAVTDAQDRPTVDEDPVGQYAQ